MKVRKMWKRMMVIVFLSLGLCCVSACSNHQEEELEELNIEEQSESEESEETNRTEPKEMEQKEAEPAETIFVYVCGAVSYPGVYELEKDARIYEAIACAGGLRDDAAGESVNQAQLLADGEQIYIPTKEEAASGAVSSNQQIEGMNGSETNDGKVHINTASKEEFMTLNGIGETRADSILAYREANGPFENVEELMNVEGIKEGVFSKIKDDIAL